MSDAGISKLFNRARVDDRQVNELIGIAHGIIADGTVNQREAEYLFKWLASNREANENPIVGMLFDRIANLLDDDVLDAEEAASLLDTLTQFSAGDFELGEAAKSCRLPFCDPFPDLVFPNRSFCFTGTFAYGSRKDCAAAIERLAATESSLNRKTHYLVIGAYATDSWAHSSFGRKIEKAAFMRSEGVPISIVGEEHWVSQMTKSRS